MNWIERINRIFQFNRSTLAIIEQDQYAGNHNKDCWLISCGNHITQNEKQYLIQSVSTTNIKCKYEQNAHQTIITVNYLCNDGNNSHADDLQ